MEKTTNLGLLKPAQEDFYNVDDFNANADILDNEIQTVKNDYVKKSGDSMSGDLSFDTNHNIHANSDNGQLVFMGGSEWNKGAGISLWGKDKNGAFTIHSVDENGNMKTLCGWNNGSLTWCDKELATQEHVSDNYLSLNGGTMKGDIELGGNAIYGNWYKIRNNDDNSFIGMSGGGNHSWETSSTLVLFGNNAGDNAGKAVLNSHGHNLAVCQNGQLLFNNQNIVRSVNGVNADASGNVSVSSLSTSVFMPDYTAGVTLTITDGSTCKGTVPSDGFIFFGMASYNTNGTFHLYINGKAVFNGWTIDGGNDFIFLCPFSKGDTFEMYCAWLGQVTFYPCKGAD